MKTLPLPSNKRLILSLALSQALNSACVPISVIVASLTVVELSGGNGRWAGVPTALGMLGGAIASFFAGRLLPKVGYRKVLFFACVAGMAGSSLAGFASLHRLLFPFLAAFLGYGMAIGLIGMSRYAAAEASEPSARARSMGMVVMGATAGAILGPLLVDPFGNLAVSMGLPSLSGPWLAVFLCYSLALLNTFFLLHPEPKELARLRAVHTAASGTAAAPSLPLTLGALLARPRVFLPMISMISAQSAMVLVMAITPLHMHHHHHAMATISGVITAHFVGMYGLSPLSGWLADRMGRMPTVGLGGLVLAFSCVMAPRVTGTGGLMVALFLLGLGWSFCFLGGSSALAEGLSEKERGKVQGFTEALVSLSSAAASLGSGLLFASFGFGRMTGVGLVASALPLLCYFVAIFAAKKTSPTAAGA